MAFYYPQDVTLDMGPTSVIPGTHYYNTPDQAHQRAEAPLCAPAGTVTLVHYDLWHRATPNDSDQKRFMMKFLFCRLHNPERPSWNNNELQWRPLDEAEPNDPPTELCDRMWQWHTGGENPKNGRDAPIEQLLEELQSEEEYQRLRAAYALGAVGEPAVPALMHVLEREASERLEANLERHHTNPGQLDSAYALGATGPAAVPALVKALNHPDWWMRATAADTLGDMGQFAGPAIPGLTCLLQDESAWVRRNATEALGIMGPAAAEAALPLANLLRDEHSYVRHNAATALWRLGPDARAATQALRQALEDESYYVRGSAELALARLCAH